MITNVKGNKRFPLSLSRDLTCLTLADPPLFFLKTKAKPKNCDICFIPLSSLERTFPQTASSAGKKY